MVEVLEIVGPGQIGKLRVIDVERQCPRCGANWEKTKPTLAEVRRAVQEELCRFEERLLELDPEAEFGYTGSVASGEVGNPDKSHYGLMPDIRGECGTKYDVDGFVISNKYCKKMRKRRGKRFAYSNKDMRSLEKDMRNALKSRSELAHMKGGNDRFSIVVYCPNERSKVVAKQAIFLIF